MTIDPRTMAEIGGGCIPVALALARHMPAPKVASIAYAWAFDSIQDLAKNNDRIGMRRPIPNEQAVTPQKAEQTK